MRLFRLQFLSTRPGQAIKLRAPPGFGDTPLGVDPAAPFQPMEGWIERSLFQRETIVGNNRDSFGDIPSMQRGAGEGPQDEKIERSLEEIVSRLIHNCPPLLSCFYNSQALFVDV